MSEDPEKIELETTVASVLNQQNPYDRGLALSKIATEQYLGRDVLIICLDVLQEVIRL